MIVRPQGPERLICVIPIPAGCSSIVAEERLRRNGCVSEVPVRAWRRASDRSPGDAFDRIPRAFPAVWRQSPYSAILRRMKYYRILPVLLLLLSCSSRYTRTETTKSDIDESYSTSTTLPIDVDSEDKLAYASRAAGEGEWMESIHAYQGVYDDRSAAAEDRSRALLGLGDVWANPLNPFKDYGTSLFYLQKIGTEFPDSKHLAKAQNKIESVRMMIDQKESVSSGQQVESLQTDD